MLYLINRINKLDMLTAGGAQRLRGDLMPTL